MKHFASAILLFIYYFQNHVNSHFLWKLSLCRMSLPDSTSCVSLLISCLLTTKTVPFFTSSACWPWEALYRTRCQRAISPTRQYSSLGNFTKLWRNATNWNLVRRMMCLFVGILQSWGYNTSRSVRAIANVWHEPQCTYSTQGREGCIWTAAWFIQVSTIQTVYDMYMRVFAGERTYLCYISQYTKIGPCVWPG